MILNHNNNNILFNYNPNNNNNISNTFNRWLNKSHNIIKEIKKNILMINVFIINNNFNYFVRHVKNPFVISVV